MKRCYKCKEIKSLSEFHKNKRRSDGVQNKCKSCKKISDAEYRQENIDYFRDRAKKQKQELIEWYKNLKSKLKCSKCGEDHIACLDFHHEEKAQKFLAVSKMIARGFSKKKILEEIQKCEILCSNCHRKEEWNQRMAL